MAAHTKSALIVPATPGVAWLLFALPGGVLVDRVARWPGRRDELRTWPPGR